MSNIKFVTTIFTLLITTIISQHHHDEMESHDEHLFISTTDHHPEHHNEDTWTAIGITTFAGSASFFGAFAMFCIKQEYIGIMPSSLAFAAGVIIYLSFFNLIPESIDQFHHALDDESEAMADLYALLCVIFGVLITLLMETLFRHLGVDPHDHSDSTIGTTITQTDTPDFARVDSAGPLSENESIDPQLNRTVSNTSVPANPKQMNRKPTEKPDKPTNYSHVSYSVAFALIMHHFPEGIATFVSLYHDLEFGLLVAFALALHDIPSGICISVPIYLASGSKCKPFVLCLLAGIVYPIGALIGWIIIEMTSEQFLDIFIAILFGVTGGIMIYISFVELLPTAIIAANKYSLKKNENKNRYNVSTVSTILFFIGLLVMAISNIVLIAAGGHSH